MSNKNYNKMYNNPKPEVVEEVVQEVETAVEPIAEPVVEVQTAIEEVAEPVVLEDEKEADITSAIVVNCAKLNVREEPSPKGAVVAVIDASNEVVICASESFGNYYKVCTASGIEGYCIKDYLKLK
jgi:hypothetical protein